jgi:hypothetical protein
MYEFGEAVNSISPVHPKRNACRMPNGQEAENIQLALPSGLLFKLN